MRTRLIAFLRAPELVDDGALRLLGACLLAAGAIFFFRLSALPILAAGMAGGSVVLFLLWAGFHRLGFRPLGAYWPGLYRGLAIALLAACVMPPGIPPVLAALFAALAVVMEAVERRALVPLAASGVMAAWLLAWLWQSRTGVQFVAPFDLHSLDEPVGLWVRFQASTDPVRAYAGQVPGPIGATSFGLLAVVTLALSYARSVSWHLVGGFYLPLLLVALFARLPLDVYLLDGPALLFAAVVAAESRRLPRSASWRVAIGVLAGLVAAILLAGGWAYEAFGAGIALATGLVAVFQFFGLAGAPGAMERRAFAAEAQPVAPVAAPAPGGRVPLLEAAALIVFTPLGLLLVLRDRALAPSQRRSLAMMGVALYLVALGGSLTWLWYLRVPG